MGDPANLNLDPIFQGPGEMRALCQAFNWSGTVLGASANWPQSLRSTVQLILASPFPIVVLLGEELIQIYNDGYRKLMGSKHPEGLGQPTRQCWPEVWHINQPIYQSVREGNSQYFEDALYPINRSGHLAEARFTLAYSPVFDDLGGIAGVMVTVLETTKQVLEKKLNEEALAESEQRFSQFVATTSEIVYTMSWDWQQMIQLDGKNYLKNTITENDNWLEEYIPPIEHERILTLIQQAINERVPFEAEHQVFRRDGSVGWVTSRAIPILDITGNIQHWLGAANDVTERKQAEEKLQQAERRLRLATEAANMATWEWHITDNLVYWNDKHFELFGLEPQSAPMPAEMFFDHVHPAERERVGSLLKQALAQDEVFDTEFCAVLKDGSTRWMCGYGRVMKKVEGQAMVMNGVMYDIDARRQTENLRHEFELQYRTLFESIDEGFCTVEVIFDDQEKAVDYRFLQTNPAFIRLTGLSDAVGKTVRELLPTQEEFWFEVYGRIAKTGEPARFEHQAQAIDTYFDVYAFRIGEADEHQVAVLFDDIRDRKKAEEALKANEARLADIFESLPIGIGELDLNGRIVMANNALTRFMPTGLMPSQDEDRKDRWLAYNPDGSRLEVKDYPGARALRGEHIVSPIEMRYTQDDGNHIWTHVTAVPLKNAQGLITGHVSIVIDINDLKLAEKALQQADQRKDEFLAMLAHELRNPMSIVRNGLSILELTTCESDPVVQQTVTLMNRQVDHLVRLVDDLLDISRITQNKIELKRERIELATLVSDSVKAMSGQYAAAGKQLLVSPFSSNYYVLGDPTRLSQVVTNLLTNGLRYTGDNGQVLVSLSQQADHVVIKVSDNGIGLTQDQLTTIFDLFVQADNSLARSQGGLGIGLTLVQRLVQMHGGQVEARSHGLGSGTEFLVHLPLIAEPEQPVSLNSDGLTDRKPGQHILVIDDNVDATVLVSILLKLKGYEVDSRKGGLEGIKAAAAMEPAVILCDIGMPGMDGYETARLIRQQPWGKSIPLIALTGYGQQEDKELAKDAGFDGHLVKPVNVKDLIRLMDELLNKTPSVV